MSSVAAASDSLLARRTSQRRWYYHREWETRASCLKLRRVREHQQWRVSWGGVAGLHRFWLPVPVHAQVVQLSRLLDSHARKCLRFVKSSISHIPQTLPPVVGFLKRLSRQIRCSNSNSRPFSSIIYVSYRIFPPTSSWTPNKGYLRLQAQHVIYQDYLCQVTYKSGF